MTSEADDSAVRREVSREGPGNQPGGIPSSLVGHVVPREGPGIKPRGIPGTSVQRTKRKLANYTMEQKYEAIMAVEGGKSTKKKVAADLGVPQNTLSTWLKKSEQIKESYRNSEFGPQRKRVRVAKFPDVEEALLTWFKNARCENVVVSGPLLIHKANCFARDLGIPESEFSCSTGWLERFKERHGITFKKVCGEANSVDHNSEKMNDWNERLQSILREFAPENIFNADETGLFYRALPDKTLELKNVDCHGGKQSKERLTALICANMTGTEKVKLLVIGKSQKPRCFKNVKTLPVEYRANKKSWMVSELFTEWLCGFDRRMHCQRRKVAMVVDNCRAHPSVPGLKAVTLVYLPPNTTRVTQPMDQGVIQSLKVQYRNLVMHRQAECIDNNTKFEMSVLDAIRLLHQAWASVKPSTIANCFCHAKFLPPSSDLEALDDDEDPDDDIPLSRLMSGRVALMDYAAFDDHLPTSASLTDGEIVSSIISAREKSSADDSDDDDGESSTPVQAPSLQKSQDAIETLRALVETQDGVPETVLQSVAVFSNYVAKLKINARCAKQSLLTDFF